MSDLEERLRTAVVRHSQDFEPSPDLPDRIVARVDHQRRVRRLVTGTVVTAAAAAAVVVVSLVGTLGHDEGSMWATDRGRPATSVPQQGPAPSSPDTTTTTVGGSGPGTSTADTAVPQGPAITLITPLSRQGIGPITAGMTLRAAQDAARTTVTPSPGGSGGRCVEAHVEGLEESIVLVVEPPAEPGADPMDGVVRAVTGSVVLTTDGAMVGQTRDELVVALGQPTDTSNQPSSVYGSGAELLVFEVGGYAYGALVVDDLVLGLQSGDPAWIGDPDGCPS